MVALYGPPTTTLIYVYNKIIILKFMYGSSFSRCLWWLRHIRIHDSNYKQMILQLCVCVFFCRSLLRLRFMGRAPPHLWRNNKINMLIFISNSSFSRCLGLTRDFNHYISFIIMCSFSQVSSMVALYGPRTTAFVWLYITIRILIFIYGSSFSRCLGLTRDFNHYISFVLCINFRRFLRW